jgi:RNA polymerase sigma factor (sigma-70 family)
MPDSRVRDLSAVYRENGGELKGFLRRWLKSEQDVEDLAQEAFLRLHGAQPKQTIEQPRSFLFRIARNLLTDHFRRKRRTQVDLDDPEIAAALADTAPPPERELQSQAWLHRYQRGLDRLSPKCRAVFVKCRLEGLPHAQIAAELGISRKMVEKYMTQALLSLRRELSEFLDQHDGHE